MAEFNADGYFTRRSTADIQQKITDLQSASQEKINNFDRARLASVAEAADSKKRNSSSALSILQDITGASDTGVLAPDGILGAPINTAVALGSGLSKLSGYIASGVYDLDAMYLNKDVPQQVKDARARMLTNAATPEDMALLAMPRGDVTQRAAPKDYTQELRKDFTTNLQQIQGMETSISRADTLRKFFDLSGAVHTQSKDALTGQLGRDAAESIDTFRQGFNQVKDGQVGSGLMDMASGLGGAVSKIPGAAMDNPLGVTTFLAENAANLAASGLGRIPQALSNVGYGVDAFGQGVADHVAKNKGAMPTNEDLAWKAGIAATAVAAEYAGDKLSGVTDLFKGASKSINADARKLFKDSVLSSVISNPITRTAGAIAEGGSGEFLTEGYQTWAENAIKMQDTTLNEAFEGGAVGAIIGGGTSTVAHLGKELTGTTTDKLETSGETRRQQADFAAMAKANDASTLVDPAAKTYNPEKAVQVWFEHAKAADTTPEVKQANLLKARELVQNLEATQERNVRVLDIASTPSALSEAKDELIGLKEQLIATDPENQYRVAVLDQQIALREEAIALSSDKVALKRLSGEVKRSEQQLSSTKTLQENFADSIRKNATVDEVAMHIAKATRPMSADNMPDIEESRQSVQALVNIAMVSPSSISVEDANNLVDNKNSTLTPEQRDYFRKFSEARIAENNLMNLDKVHQAIFTGTAQDTGIVEYRRTIGQALEAGDQKAAEKSLLALQTFAQNHAEKQSIATKLFGSIRISGDKQVLKVKTGGWEVVPAGKPLGDAVVKANGGFKIHPNSGEFVGNMQTEVAALNQVNKEQQAAFTLRFGKPSSSFVAMPTDVSTSVPKVNTSAAPVQKAAESVQVASSVYTPKDQSTPEKTKWTSWQAQASSLEDGDTLFDPATETTETVKVTLDKAGNKSVTTFDEQGQPSKRLLYQGTDGKDLGAFGSSLEVSASNPAAVVITKKAGTTAVVPGNSANTSIQIPVENEQVAPAVIPPAAQTTAAPTSVAPAKIDTATGYPISPNTGKALTETEGWKLHLNLKGNTANAAKISTYLTGLGVKHKVGKNSGQVGKDMTVYIGSKDKASEIAAGLNDQFATDMFPAEGDALADDVQIKGNVWGRFEIGRKDIDFHQYGQAGIPFFNDDMSQLGYATDRKAATEAAKVRADKALTERYGAYYSGSVAPVVPAVESTTSQSPAKPLSVTKQAEGTTRPDSDKVAEAEVTATPEEYAEAVRLKESSNENDLETASERTLQLVQALNDAVKINVVSTKEGEKTQAAAVSPEDQKALEDFQAKAQDRVLRFLAPEETAKLSAITDKLSSLYKDVLSKTKFYIQSGVRSPASAFHNAPIIGLQAYLFTTEHLIEVTEERRLSYTLAHELAHLKDQATGYESETIDALYKGGPVFDELMGVLQGKKEAFIESMFSYILVSPKVGVNVQRELYAQLAALYANDPQLLKAILPNGYTFIKDQFASSEQKDEQARSKLGLVAQEKTTTENPTDLSTGTSEPRLPGSTGESTGDAGLAALTAEPKSAPNTLYQDRNLLVDHFSQAVAGLTAASQRPLVAVKDFISSLGDTLDFSGFLKDYKATDKQEAALALFAKVAGPKSKWTKTLQGLLIHGYFTQNGKYNEDRKNFFKNPFNWMISKDTEGVYSIEENTNTALVYAALTTLLELADAPPYNDNKTINAILGRDEDALVPFIARDVLGKVGTLATLVRNNAGQTAVSALGLKADDKAGQDLKPKLEGGMGAMVEALLLSLKLIEIDPVSPADINAVLKATNEIDGKKEGKGNANGGELRSFLKIARNAETGEYTPAVKELLEGLRGSNNVLDKLMSVEAALKYPSLTPLVSTQTTTKTGQQVPSLLTDTNNQNSSQANYTREDMWKLLNAVTPEVAGAMAGIEEISDTKTQNTKRQSIKAKNDGLWRELNHYHDYVKDVLLATADKLKQPFYLDYSVWLQQRVGIATNVINPQTSKAHRALFYRKDWESKVMMDNDDMMDNFMLRVGEGFGIKTDRDTVDASFEQITKVINDPVVVTAVEALQKLFTTDSVLTKEDQANLLAAVKLGKENFHTLDALVAYAHYQTALDTNAEFFVTHLQAEVDGVANGPILAHALFGAASSAVMGNETQDQADARALNATMERGGIYTEGSGEQAFNDWIADPVNQDLYENTIAKVIQSIANSVNSASPGLANAVYFFTGTLTKEDGEVSSDGRKIIKGPVTEMVFGSGVAKSIDHMAELFIAKVYDVLEKSTNGDEKYPADAVIKNLNLLLGTSLSLQDAKKFNTEFFLDSAEAASIKTKFKKVFAEPVTEAIETNFADFLERRTAFTKAAEFTHGLYSTVYAAMRQEMLDKLVADELASPGTGIASTYKTVPVNRFDLSKGTKKETTYLRDLSKAEERQLEKQLAAMFPVVQTLFSLESQQPKAGLRIGKFRQEVSMDSAYTTTAHFRIGKQDSTSTTVRGLKKVHEGPGVAMLPLLIHSLDSYISHSAQMGMQMLNIHDAVITGLNTIYKAAERMNEQTFHALLSFSPMSEMYQALENTVKGLGTLSLSNETSAALADYLAKFAVDNQMESSNVLADMLQDTKAAAAKADTVKFTAMQQWAFVNQYARENSSYAVTEADQTKVSNALTKVTSEVPATALLAANNTYKSVSKAMATAYAKKVRTAAWLADKKAKEAKKPMSSDNMPDMDESATTPPTQTYNTQDIYNALTYNPVSVAFDTHLREVLTDIVEKLHGAFGSFKEAMAQSTAESASALFTEAVTTGKAPLTFSLLGANIKFNDQQAFVAEQVHATILAALDNTNGNKSAVYNELSKLFRETRARLKDSAWAKDPATAGLYDRVFNQIPADTEGRSNYLAEFAALGLAHEEFNALLKVPTKMEAAVFADTTILGVLKRLFAKILETFNGRVTGTVPGQQADKKLTALVTKLVMIENKRKAVLEAERKGLLKFIDKQMSDLRVVKKSAVSKLANSPKFMKNRNVFIGAASGVVATVADSQVGLFFRNIEKVRNANFDGRSGMAMGFLGEMNGPKPMIQKLLRTIKHFEGQRKKIITMTGKFVLQGFDNQGRDLEDFDKRALTKVLLHTGAHSLLDHFDTDKLLTLLKDPKALAAEVAVFEQQLKGYTAAQQTYFVEQSRSLGYWMVTGKFTHEMPMKNANNIARGFMSGTKHTLTEAQVAAATVTLDALASLNALSYMDVSQINSVAKSLEQELARPDKGNGVRLLLLSHKEMEQQAKERLFSGNEALMIKGYMPEIYNPHTDVKAANQKDGEMLEAFGYIAGAAVANDPADFDPEAKRLYTLRDGAIMPWLSGIFSFSGMRSKGTKHHGKFANRTQQAITQDKLAAIQARSPSESGYNFDPRQVKDSHMAPLMNSLGQAVNYQYMMHNDTKDNLLERDTRFDSVMGALNGSIYDKENSAIHNRKSVEVFFKEFDEGYTKEPRAFLEVSATSTDPELRDIYKMLPQTTKDAIREIWGKDAMMVRVSHLDIAFGYRKQSLSNSFDKEKEDRNLIEKAMVPLTLTVLHTVGKFKGMSDAEAERFTKRAGVYVRRGEDVWQAVVKETKDIIVVKSGVATIANITSNLLLLKLYGVGSVTGLKDMQIAWVGARDYDRDSKKLFELEALIASKATTTGLDDLNLQVRELKDALARNPVRKLIEEGLMPTIVEDVSEDEDIYGFESRVARSTEKYTNKLNKTVVAAGKQMYMTHDTQMYKGMAQLTQLSDFVARYALYQHLTTRTDNPISEKVAIQEASDAFINYDVPMQRDIQYLDDMGILPFTKYFLRIQRVIRGRFRHAPGKVALLLLAQGYLDWLPSPLDSSIFFKLGNNPMNWGALQFPGVLDELATYKAATSLFK